MKPGSPYQALLLLTMALLALPGQSQDHRVIFIPDADIPAKWLRPVDVATAEQTPAVVSAMPHALADARVVVRTSSNDISISLFSSFCLSATTL